MTHLTLHMQAAKCDHPLPQSDNDAKAVLVSGYRDPALEGTNVTFSCSSGLNDIIVLTGPSTSTCMGDGEWEPDPRDAECKGITNL